MAHDQTNILRLAAEVLKNYLKRAREHEEDIAAIDAAVILLEIVVRHTRDEAGVVPILRLVERILSEQRHVIPEVGEATAEREARAAIAVPNGGPPDPSEMLAEMRKALEAAYPERPARKRRRKPERAPIQKMPLPTWCRGVIAGGRKAIGTVRPACFGRGDCSTDMMMHCRWAAECCSSPGGDPSCA